MCSFSLKFSSAGKISVAFVFAQVWKENPRMCSSSFIFPVLGREVSRLLMLRSRKMSAAYVQFNHAGRFSQLAVLGR
jgi:hypothetical protein